MPSLSTRIFSCLGIVFVSFFSIPTILNWDLIPDNPTSASSIPANALSSRLLVEILIACFSMSTVLLLVCVLISLRNWRLFDWQSFVNVLIISAFSLGLLLLANSDNHKQSSQTINQFLFLFHLYPVFLLCSILLFVSERFESSRKCCQWLCCCAWTFIIISLGKLLTLYSSYFDSKNILRASEITLSVVGLIGLLRLIYVVIVKKLKNSSRDSFENHTNRFHIIFMFSMAIVILVGDILMLIYPSYNWEKMNSVYFPAQIVIFMIFILFLNLLYAQAFYIQPVLDREAMELKMSFLRYISHELRTPLNSVVMGLQLLSENLDKSKATGGVETAKYAQIVYDISRSCDVAVDILDRMLLRDQLQSSSVTLDKVDIHVWKFVNDTVRPFILQAQSMGLELTVLAFQNGWNLSAVTISADRQRIGQVIRNLVSNALVFTPRGGKVKVQVQVVPSTAGYDLQLAVIDTGCGISQDRQETLFEVGSQFAPGTVQQGSGSGLGLAIAKGIVEAHGGRMSVFSEGIGRGCAVTVTLSIDHVDLNWRIRSAPNSPQLENPLDSSALHRAISGARIISPQPDNDNDVPLMSPSSSLRQPFKVGYVSSFRVFPSKRVSAGSDLHFPASPQGDVVGISTKHGLPSMTSFRISSNNFGMFRMGGGGGGTSHPSDDPLPEASHGIAFGSRNASFYPSSTFSRVSTANRAHRRRSSLDGNELNLSFDVEDHDHVEMIAVGPGNSPAATDRRYSLNFNLETVPRINSQGESSHSSTTEVSDQIVPAASTAAATDGKKERMECKSDSIRRSESKVKEEGEGDRFGNKRRGWRILVVDDVTMNRTMLCRLLKDRCASSEQAEDGLHAVEKVRQSLISGDVFDIITMDYQMPNMDGPTATKLIRQLGYNGLILGVTGNSLPTDIATFLDHGADTVLLKPLKIANFDAAVQGLLGEK